MYATPSAGLLHSNVPIQGGSLAFLPGVMLLSKHWLLMCAANLCSAWLLQRHDLPSLLSLKQQKLLARDAAHVLDQSALICTYIWQQLSQSWCKFLST